MKKADTSYGESRTYAENRKVLFDYEILEKYEAGIELLGHEVKAVRSGKVSLPGSYVIVRGGEVYISGMEIAPYQEKNTPEGYEPRRNRRLLLRKQEIAELAGYEQKKGLTIVPISVYNSRRNVKVSIAVVRGKKKHDKRESTKKRELDREIAREYTDR
jgi:SsrA-binding protein